MLIEELYTLSDSEVMEHPVVEAGVQEADFILPTAIRYSKEIHEMGLDYLKRLTDYAPTIRTSWVPGEAVAPKHALCHTPICTLLKKMKPTPRRLALPSLREVLPLDEECVEEIEWTKEDVVVGERVVGGEDVDNASDRLSRKDRFLIDQVFGKTYSSYSFVGAPQLFLPWDE